MRRLLLITNYFPPCAASASHRCLAMATHLPAHGWEVAVVAPPIAKFEAVDAELARKIPAATHMYPVPYPDQLWARIMSRVVWAEQWLPPAWAGVKRAIAEFKPDVVLTTSPPSCVHYLGMAVKARFGIPWVADMRDPWATNVTLEYMLGLRGWIEATGEAAMARRADLIIANTPSNLHALVERYPQAADRAVLVTNGFDPLPPPAGQSRRAAKDAITLIHAGEFYARRDPRPLLRVLAILRQLPPPGLPRLRLRLLGRMNEELDITGLIDRLGLGDVVELAGQVSHAEVLSGLAAADILLSIQGPGYSGSIPAKLYEYLAFDKPILQLAEPGGDIDWALASSGVPHRVVSQSDEGAIREALLALVAALTDGAGPSGDPRRLRAFTREHLMGELAGHLDRALQVRSHVAVPA